MNIKRFLVYFLSFFVILSAPMGYCVQSDAPNAAFNRIVEQEQRRDVTWRQQLQKVKDKALVWYKQHKKAVKITAGAVVAVLSATGVYHIFYKGDNGIPVPPVISNNGNGNNNNQLSLSFSDSHEFLSFSSSSVSSSSSEDDQVDDDTIIVPSVAELLDKNEAMLTQAEELERLDKMIDQGKEKDQSNEDEIKRPGYEVLYTDWARNNQASYNLTQLPVLTQFGTSGGNASCGYHALLRSGQLVRQLSQGSDIDATALTDESAVKNYFYKPTFWDTCVAWWYNTEKKPAGQWRQYIMQQRKNNDNSGEWLCGDELKSLIDTFKLLDARSYVIIENFAVIAHGEQGFDDISSQIYTIVEDNNPFCIFFIGDMNVILNESGEDVGTDGHWYPLVLHKKDDGTRDYYVMNSAGNKDKRDDSRVLCIIGMVEQFLAGSH